MLMRIEDEIKQEKFSSEYHKAHINLIFTAAWATYDSARVLKPFNLSIQQFNVLRILKGRFPQPATVKLLSERMIDKTSNASRLVDKLNEKGFIKRSICQKDRRRVNIVITKKGIDLLEQASKQIESIIHQSFSSLSLEEAEELNRLLDKLRQFSD